MDNNVLIALIGEGSSGLVAITALLLNYRGFSSMDARFSSIDAKFASLEARMQAFETRIDARLNMMRVDMKDLNKTMTALEIDVALLKDKAGV